ncbi:MAG: hypothetical protein H7842_12355 [Gammaproteobacteria bacterium SHHR-1]
MNREQIKRLDAIIQRVQTEPAADLRVGNLSTGERIYIALSLSRPELLPFPFRDPIEAWHRLDADWRREVCAWRGWPQEWAHGG